MGQHAGVSPELDLLSRFVPKTRARAMLRQMDAPALSMLSTQALRDQFQLSEAVATRLHSAFALGRAACRSPVQRRPRLRNARDVDAWARPRIAHLPYEELWLLAVDAGGHLRGARLLSRGGESRLSVTAKDVLSAALHEHASAMVLLHNHPSGGLEPSPEDVAFTKRIAHAAAAIDLALLDHVIVASTGFGVVPMPP